MIQEEWEENLRQFETMLSILIIPFFGRWYGRRFAYFGESELIHIIEFVQYRVSTSGSQRMMLLQRPVQSMGESSGLARSLSPRDYHIRGSIRLGYQALWPRGR